MKYNFITDHRQEYPVKLMCRVLQVSVSGYDAWKQRGPSKRSKANTELSKQIEQVYRTHRQVYGSPRVHAVLKTQGMNCERKRIARLMNQAGLSVKPRRLRTNMTDSRQGYPFANNVLGRDFTADAPNTKWVADITGDGWQKAALSCGHSGRVLPFHRWMCDEFFVGCNSGRRRAQDGDGTQTSSSGLASSLTRLSLRSRKSVYKY